VIVINARNIAALALVLLVLAGYHNSLSGAFVFDDLPAMRAGRLAESIAEFEQALKVKPDYADARDNLALARKELQRRK